MSPFK